MAFWLIKVVIESVNNYFFKEYAIFAVNIFRKFLKNFITNEIINWSALCKEFERGLRSGDTASFVFSASNKVEGGDKRWADLKNRVVEHVRHSICVCVIVIV